MYVTILERRLLFTSTAKPAAFSCPICLLKSNTYGLQLFVPLNTATKYEKTKALERRLLPYIQPGAEMRLRALDIRDMSKPIPREIRRLSGAITESLKDEAGPCGLVYIEQTDHLPGFTRNRSGEDFAYLDVKGATITNKKVTARIKALTIPPAWSKVWICPVT